MGRYEIALGKEPKLEKKEEPKTTGQEALLLARANAAKEIDRFSSVNLSEDEFMVPIGHNNHIETLRRQLLFYHQKK